MFSVIVNVLLVAGIISLIFALPIIAPRLLVILGDIDEWWSPVRTLPPEGEMYSLARGNPRGPFAGILESVPEYDYNRKTGEFEHTGTVSELEQLDYLSRNGIGWVGFNRFLMMRAVRYDKWEKKPNSDEFGLVPKVRPGPAIFFQYYMATEVKSVKTSDNFPVNAVVTFTLQIVNPSRALFLAGGWETQANGGVQGVLREYVGTKTIDALRIEKETGGTAGLIGKLTGTDSDSLNERLQQFGIKITAASFIDYDLVEGDPEAAAAVQAKAIAQQKGEAAVIAAKLDADARTERARGITAEYQARAQAGREHAGTFALAEAIKENETATTLVIGNTNVAVPTR